MFIFICALLFFLVFLYKFTYGIVSNNKGKETLPSSFYLYFGIYVMFSLGLATIFFCTKCKRSLTPFFYTCFSVLLCFLIISVNILLAIIKIKGPCHLHFTYTLVLYWVPIEFKKSKDSLWLLKLPDTINYKVVLHNSS